MCAGGWGKEGGVCGGKQGSGNRSHRKKEVREWDCHTESSCSVPPQSVCAGGCGGGGCGGGSM